jgi:hypothetical protein
VNACLGSVGQMTRAPREPKPEPHFGRLVTEDDLAGIVLSAHAMRRFVERLQPDIPGAEQIAETMAPLEELGSGNRSELQQRQLRSYRDWMTAHVQSHILEVIRCEGFWATERPRWSRSRTPSDGYLQVGGMCGFPVILDNLEIILATCTGGTNITWEIALERGYTLMPKPYLHHVPELLREPSWATIASRAWRTRRQHGGLLAAFGAERVRAAENTRRENDRRQADSENSQRVWREQRDRAAQLFRERNSVDHR